MLLQDTDSAGRTQSTLLWKQGQILADKQIPPTHAACCSKGLLIAICAATSLAALSFEGAVTAHSLFGYPVEDKEDVGDLNPTRCGVKKE